MYDGVDGRRTVVRSENISWRREGSARGSEAKRGSEGERISRGQRGKNSQEKKNNNAPPGGSERDRGSCAREGLINYGYETRPLRDSIFMCWDKKSGEMIERRPKRVKRAVNGNRLEDAKEQEAEVRWR